MNSKGWVKLLLTTIMAMGSLQGCTVLGTHVVSHPATYLSDSRLANMDLQRFDTEKRHICIPENPKCLHYLFAKAYRPQDFAEAQNVQYQVHASGNGVENQVRFAASPEAFNRMPGTAVLFHGFGGSKEAMLVTSIWFRALGFDVIAFDLFGHGESQEDFVFGAREHVLFTQILAQLNQNQTMQKPVVAVGHSMGALPAINLLKDSQLVDGAILMAPMVQFDRAAKHYLAYKSKLLNSLFSDSMDDIVSAAMQKQTVSVRDTDIPRILQDVHKPVLILSSDIDTVSPAESFSETANPAVKQQILSNRSHPSLIAFDNSDSGMIEDWLKQVLVTAR